MTPRVVGVPPTHPCRRGATRCTGRAPVPKSWCSDLCRRVDRGLAAMPPMAGSPGMTVGREAAVVHAFDWLDARRRVVA